MITTEQGRELADVLDMAVRFTSTDLARPVLTTVQVSAKGGKVMLRACDGFRLVRIEAKHKGDLEPTLIPGDAVRAFVKAVRAMPRSKATATPARLTSDKLTFIGPTGYDAEIRYRPADMTYPDLDKLIPKLGRKKHSEKVALNADLLSDTTALAKKYGSRVAGVRIINGPTPNDPVTILWQRLDDFKATAVLMPMFVQWDQ